VLSNNRFRRKVAASPLPWSRCFSAPSRITIKKSMVLRSLRDHYSESLYALSHSFCLLGFYSRFRHCASQKVSPLSPLTIVKGALNLQGLVLKHNYGEEEASVYVMWCLAPEDEDSTMDQLFIHVDVSKPSQKKSLILHWGLYKDALGIHSASTKPKL